MPSQGISTTSAQRVLEGLRVQLRRSERFRDSIDPAGAIETYRRLVDLLLPRLPELRRSVGLPIRPGLGAEWRARRRALRRARHRAPATQVYAYWGPLETAPPIVRACLRQLRRVHPDARILDHASAHELVAIPDRVSRLSDEGRHAHFTDYLRTRILEEHGGIWADATLWVPRPLDASHDGLLRGGVILPRYTERTIANWFIAAQPKSIVMGLQRRALEAWWDRFDDLPDYFLYHRIFDSLCAVVPEFRGEWSAAGWLSATTTHALQLEMMQPYEPRRLERIMALAPVQKLSHKFDEVPAGSVLEHLLQDGAD